MAMWPTHDVSEPGCCIPGCFKPPYRIGDKGSKLYCEEHFVLFEGRPIPAINTVVPTAEAWVDIAVVNDTKEYVIEQIVRKANVFGFEGKRIARMVWSPEDETKVRVFYVPGMHEWESAKITELKAELKKTIVELQVAKGAGEIDRKNQLLAEAKVTDLVAKNHELTERVDRLSRMLSDGRLEFEYLPSVDSDIGGRVL